MITDDEKTEIKNILGHRYTSLVQKELVKKGLLNKMNKPYSNGQIRNVMNGVHHQVIEKVIWQMVKKAKRTALARKNILTE
ncbi:hypothetical protein [Tenacibaculum soleae]|uniref:hypothetical protein n=1 Tax=Tenacibaculum soleae TaxID=447689 RepID=UPI0026E35987|nr:hypothetical protein [Tenacibaculum soleae]MDO6813790.1 hypothetical protein [Tenacibaculum soleae]